MSPDAANRLKALVSGSLDKAAFAKTDFVIEAVFENMDVKKKVFAELEQYVAPETHPRDQHLVAVDHRDGVRA